MSRSTGKVLDELREIDPEEFGKQMKIFGERR
jgi:hypothetical protein